MVYEVCGFVQGSTRAREAMYSQRLATRAWRLPTIRTRTLKLNPFLLMYDESVLSK